MKRFLGTVLMISVLALVGCKKEDPNPELLDPIYKDLEKRSSESQKSWDEDIAKIKELREKLEKAEPNTIDKKNVLRDLDKASKSLIQSEQNAKYYKIRLQRRLLVDRLTYKEAFAKDQPWPDPKEYSDYLVNIRLNNVNLNWNARVPKLQSRLESRSPATKGGDGEKGKDKTAEKPAEH
jgi:hypothetical protein